MSRFFALLFILPILFLVVFSPSESVFAITAEEFSQGSIASSDFTFEVSAFSPNENASEYTQWPKENLKIFLQKLARIMLIFVPLIAVILSVVAGAIMAISVWDSDRVSKAKTVIEVNGIAIVVALLSSAMIQLVSWFLI